MTTTRTRYPAETAMRVAAELCAAFKPACGRLIVAGSLRRRKPAVGDVEILYQALTVRRPDPHDMFAILTVNLADEVIAALEASGVLARRPSVTGTTIFGPQNKLMLHVATGLPVDLFAVAEASWYNYLVCRTGPADSNIRIAAAAKALGYRWNPYGPGFISLACNTVHPMASEEAVFDFVGLPCTPPEFRK